MSINKIDQDKFTNKKFTLSFELLTNDKGVDIVFHVLREFIKNESWCMENIKVEYKNI